jgi:hypothetical protein
MVRLITSLILIGLISSCSAEWHMRKAIKKDPDIIDTRIVYKFDTLWTNAIKFKDSVNVNFKDSIVITNDTITTTLIKTARGKVIVKTVVKPYPIYRKVTHYKTIIKSDTNRFNSLLWQIVFAFAVVIGVSKLIDKTLK